LHVVGYYDFFSRESVGNFMIMQKQARDAATRQQQRLILGPWDHGSVGKTKVAEVDFGPDAAVDTAALQMDWFERHLKQDGAARAKAFPPVRFFSMGDNLWHDAQSWPPEGSLLQRSISAQTGKQIRERAVAGSAARPPSRRSRRTRSALTLRTRCQRVR
jgi:hypothetical protein